MSKTFRLSHINLSWGRILLLVTCCSYSYHKLSDLNLQKTSTAWLSQSTCPLPFLPSATLSCIHSVNLPIFKIPFSIGWDYMKKKKLMCKYGEKNLRMKVKFREAISMPLIQPNPFYLKFLYPNLVCGHSPEQPLEQNWTFRNEGNVLKLTCPI